METKQMCSNLLNFEEWLRAEMKAQEIKASKLGQISGVHPNTIRNYLAGRCEPTMYNVLLLVRALGYELGVFK